MKELDIIDLGFNKIIVPPHESGDENVWHYYTVELCGVSLITPSSDDIENENWSVEFFDTYKQVTIKDIDKLTTLINVLKDIESSQD